MQTIPNLEDLCRGEDAMMRSVFSQDREVSALWLKRSWTEKNFEDLVFGLRHMTEVEGGVEKLAQECGIPAAVVSASLKQKQ